VEPSGITFDVAPGETIMAAALRHGYRWPTTCDGLANCGICYIELLSGAEHLGPICEQERYLVENLPAGRFAAGPLRLACQATCAGDVVARKKGVKPREGAA
jgi:2Fe-2S ferredoxin